MIGDVYRRGNICFGEEHVPRCVMCHAIRGTYPPAPLPTLVLEIEIIGVGQQVKQTVDGLAVPLWVWVMVRKH